MNDSGLSATFDLLKSVHARAPSHADGHFFADLYKGAAPQDRLGDLATRLVNSHATGGASLAVIKAAQQRGVALTARGFRELTSPDACRVRSVPVTKGGAVLFNVELPATQEDGNTNNPLPDDGASTSTPKQPTPNQRVAVFGQLEPEQIGNGRDPVAVEDAERRTQSGGQDASLAAIKAILAGPPRTFLTRS